MKSGDAVVVEPGPPGLGQPVDQVGPQRHWATTSFTVGSWSASRKPLEVTVSWSVAAGLVVGCVDGFGLG